MSEQVRSPLERVQRLLNERDALLVALEMYPNRAMPETRRELRRITREIRRLNPYVLPSPVKWASLPSPIGES